MEPITLIDVILHFASVDELDYTDSDTDSNTDSDTDEH